MSLDLQPGDLIFFPVTSSSSWFAKSIQWIQHVVGVSNRNQKYYHVGILDWDTSYLLESTFPKSRRVLLDWTRDNNQLEVWRLKNVNSQEIIDILTWSRKHLNEWYDLWLYVTLDKYWLEDSNVCSTYVANALKAAGILTSVNPDLISPDQLASQSNLIYKVN